jgi:tRNA U55 pseudouridine synthase TruB
MQLKLSLLIDKMQQATSNDAITNVKKLKDIKQLIV